VSSSVREPSPDAAEPTEEERAAAAALLPMICGLHISRAVYLAAELGIADLLAAGPRTAAALARAAQADEQALYRVLRLLAALGVLTEPEPGSFGLTELGDRLRSDVPASMRNWAMLADTVGYILANVLHDWDDARCVRILQACHHAMAPGGRVLIIERLIPDDPREAVPVLPSDLNMLLVTGGQERTNAEYRTLLATAGLRPGQIQPVAAPYGVIEGSAA
jgi:hypothetical protein